MSTAYERRVKKLREHVLAHQKEAEVTSSVETKDVIDLGNMTIQELRIYAKANDIDLGSASKKEEIIEAIRSGGNGK